LQQHDLPAVSPGDLRAENDADEDEDDDDMDEDEDTAKASSAFYEQISFQQMAHRTWEIHTVLI